MNTDPTKPEIQDLPPCGPGDHAQRPRQTSDARTLTRAAEIFRAAGDPARLRVLDLLRGGEQCVTEILGTTGVKPSTLSQQLKLLRMEDLIVSRRSGKHLFYSLADQHIRDLLDNVLAHAGGHCAGTMTPTPTPKNTNEGTKTMSDCQIHADHPHLHGADCGHITIQHDGHVDFLHDGHLHHLHADHVDEHVLEVSDVNPAACTPDHNCGAHDDAHIHGPGCGHEAVPHGDHTDYLVAEHLHHPHEGHCDDHGPVTVLV